MKYYYKGYEIVTPFTISSNEPMFDVDTVSLSKVRSSQNVQRWEMTFNILTDSPADILADLPNFDISQNMVMPQLKEVNNRLSSISYPKGAFVTGSNGKVYMLKEDATAPNQNNLYPRPPSSGITYSTVAGATINYYRDVSDLRGITFSDGILADAGTITIIEAI